MSVLLIQILTDNYVQWQPEPQDRVELDLGCGKGGYLISLAQMYPERLFLGADVMLGRLRKVQKKVDRNCIENIRLLRVNALDLIGYILPDQSLYRIHVLCPDPWPKNRHRSKRLLSSEFLGRIAAKLCTDGILHIATDDENYFAFISEAIAGLPHYVNAPAALDDVKHIKTDFELKFEESGIRVKHMAFGINQAARLQPKHLECPQ